MQSIIEIFYVIAQLVGDNKLLTIVGAVIVFTSTQLPLLALRFSMSASCRWQNSPDLQRQILSLSVSMKNVGILKFRVSSLQVKIWETNEPNSKNSVEWFRPDVSCTKDPLCETDPGIGNHVCWDYYAGTSACTFFDFFITTQHGKMYYYEVTATVKSALWLFKQIYPKSSGWVYYANNKAPAIEQQVINIINQVPTT